MNLVFNTKANSTYTNNITLTQVEYVAPKFFCEV